MRSIETLLIIANLLTFVALIVSLPRTVHWMRYWVFIALLIAILQVVMESIRWQMIPAYTLTGVFFLAYIIQNLPPVRELIRQKRTHRLIIGLGIFGLVVSIVLPIILPVFHFPHPSGMYRIGTLTYHWVDTNRSEVFTVDKHDRRELMVQIWYPAKTNPLSLPAPYILDVDALTWAFARVHHKPEFLLGNLKYVTSNAVASAHVADNKTSYPVLIFLEALSGFRQMNTFQVEELVSHGYIVVAIDQPYSAVQVVFPDGRQIDMLSIEQMQPLVHQSYLPAERAPILNGEPLNEGIIPYLVQDVIFTLNQLTALNQTDTNGILTGRLDLKHVGAFGVSLGGIVGSKACQLEPRLQAFLVMDAAMPTQVVQSGLKQPIMWITRDAETMRLERRQAGGWSEAAIHAHQTSMYSVFKCLSGDGYFVRVPGMFHINLTDIPLWSPLWSWLGLTGPIDEQRAHRIINSYSVAFFNQHLKNYPKLLPDGLKEQYPEVLFEKH